MSDKKWYDYTEVAASGPSWNSNQDSSPASSVFTKTDPLLLNDAEGVSGRKYHVEPNGSYRFGVYSDTNRVLMQLNDAGDASFITNRLNLASKLGEEVVRLNKELKSASTAVDFWKKTAEHRLHSIGDLEERNSNLFTLLREAQSKEVADAPGDLQHKNVLVVEEKPGMSGITILYVYCTADIESELEDLDYVTNVDSQDEFGRYRVYITPLYDKEEVIAHLTKSVEYWLDN